MDLNIPSLRHRRQVAASTVLYQMQTRLFPPDLKQMLPQPCVVRRATGTILSMPRHALTELISRTYSTSRTVILSICNGLPDSEVGEIYGNGAPSFNRAVCIIILFQKIQLRPCNNIGNNTWRARDYGEARKVFNI